MSCNSIYVRTAKVGYCIRVGRRLPVHYEGKGTLHCLIENVATQFRSK